MLSLAGVALAVALSRLMPMGAALAGFGVLLLLSGVGLWEVARLCLAGGVLVIPLLEAKAGIIGILLITGMGKRRGLDEASLGWGLVLASFILDGTWSGRPLVGFLVLCAGVFLLGGFWPATGSWLSGEEGWGRRVGRGVAALSLLLGVLPQMHPILFDAWSPLILFLPGIGILWASALSVSESGQRSSLSLLWFFELQLIVVFVLGTRGGGSERIPLLLWAVLLVLGCLIAATTRAEGTSGRRPGRLLGLGAAASLLALPGLVGFAARWVSLQFLFSSSPVGFIFYGIGLLGAPILLRPVREEIRESSISTMALIACFAALLGIIIFGLAPGLTGGVIRNAWIWGYLLAVH